MCQVSGVRCIQKKKKKLQIDDASQGMFCYQRLSKVLATK